MLISSYLSCTYLNHSLSPCFFFSSRRRHTRCLSDWSSDVCSSDLRRLHLLGSNARIYIAQECTTVGSRRLHLPVQEHNPRHACYKRIHAPLHSCTKRRVHLLCTRLRDACAVPIRACSMMCAPISTRRDARVPLLLATQRCARL